MMKKTIRALAALASAFAVLAAASAVSLAASPTLPEEPKINGGKKYTDVIDVVIDGNSAAAPDQVIIQDALDRAKHENGNEGTQVRITIKEGTYFIDSALWIYPDTHLILEDGAVIKRSITSEGTMLEGYIVSEAGTAAGSEISGYGGVHDIIIEGGTWDANAELCRTNFSNMMVLTHSQNVIIKNVTFQNSVNHMLNISGSNKVLVENCTFKDSQIYKGSDPDKEFYGNETSDEQKIERHLAIEAIHLDFMNKKGEGNSYTVLDGTPCKNITVRNCEFNNVFRGIGTHHPKSNNKGDADYATDYGNTFLFEKNTFTKVRSACISAYSFKNMTIRNNTADQVGMFCDFYDSFTTTISGNTVSGSYAPRDNYYRIQQQLLFINSGDVAISGNTLKSDGKNSANIKFYNSSDFRVDSNTLSGAETNCIYIEKTDKVVINNKSKDKANKYSTKGRNEVSMTDSSVTIGYDTFSKVLNVSKSAATISNCTFNGGYINLDKANKTTISGNTINMTDSGATACIVVNAPADSVTIKGNTLASASNHCIYANTVSGKTVDISGNTFNKTSKNLVTVVDVDTVNITGNTMNKISGYNVAISVTNSKANIKDNKISGATSQCIFMRNCTGTISGNTVSGSTHPIYMDQGTSATVTGNTVKNGGDNAIFADSVTGTTISNNTITDSGNCAIFMRGSKKLTISNNKITNTKAHGIYLENDNTGTVSNNTFTGVPEGKRRVRVTDDCVNITVTPADDTAIVTPAPTGSPTTPPTTSPSPKPTTKPDDQSSEGGTSGFINRLYSLVLGRPADQGGKDYWMSQVRNEGKTGADIAKGFLYSPEFLNKTMTDSEFLDILYNVFFDRAADQGGKDYWLGKLAGGMSKQDVIMGFINSTEWANVCLSYGIPSGGSGVPNKTVEPNAQVIAFARRLYETCLGRKADEAGLMDWATKLANMQITGTNAAHGFFFSDEFVGHNFDNGEYITRLYRTFMGREADQGGFDYWMGRFAAGASREEVFQGFAQSREFGEICASYGILR